MFLVVRRCRVMINHWYKKKIIDDIECFVMLVFYYLKHCNLDFHLKERFYLEVLRRKHSIVMNIQLKPLQQPKNMIEKLLPCLQIFLLLI